VWAGPLRELGIAPETEHGAAAGEGGGAAGAVDVGAEDGVAGAVGGGGAEGRGGEAGGAGDGVVEADAPVGGDVGGARARRRGRGAWERAFAAAVAYREREGDLEVPRTHVETVTTQTTAGPDGGVGEGDTAAGVEVRLGKWINNQRTRRSSLSEERVRLLTELGMRW